MEATKTSENIQKAYDNQYSDRITRWRELSGKIKAQNIMNLVYSKKIVLTKVLDFGAGEGSILDFLNREDTIKQLYAVEISETGISQIGKRNLSKLKEVLKFDGYSTPYEENEFDLVYCSHVIEHVEHPRLVLREIKRISKYQVFEIPLDYNAMVDKNLEHFLSYGHINIFTPSLFKFLLKSEGFTIYDDILTSVPIEVIRFSWYKNLKIKKSILTELKLFIIPIKIRIKKVLYGKSRFDEIGYDAYTCLTSASGNIDIFQN